MGGTEQQTFLLENFSLVLVKWNDIETYYNMIFREFTYDLFIFHCQCSAERIIYQGKVTIWIKFRRPVEEILKLSFQTFCLFPHAEILWFSFYCCIWLGKKNKKNSSLIQTDVHANSVQNKSDVTFFFFCFYFQSEAKTNDETKTKFQIVREKEKKKGQSNWCLSMMFFNVS